MKYTDAQQKALETLDDNLEIIACAGSGKTQVISQRVVNILKYRDVEPKNIVAFTYTEKAAAELKTRILKLCRDQLGDIRGLAEMYVGTIHSWCLNTIQDNLFEFQKFSILDEIKLKVFIDKYYSRVGMATAGLERYKDTGRYISILSVLREAELTEGTELPEEWTIALEEYENTLKKYSYFDFTMIMTEAIDHLKKDKSFRKSIFDNLKYLIVDEYQDVNPIQEMLISELAKSNCNLCVVGDDDQTIYQWRGGDVRYIQEFAKRYKDVEYIKLEDNFRSTTAVVDVALKCISRNLQRLPKAMNAKGHQGYEDGDIIYNQYDNLADEDQFIVDTIKKLRGTAFKDKLEDKERGLEYSDFTILLRTWSKAVSIIEAFTEAEIPFIVSGVNELFQRPEIKAARALFEYLNNQIEEEVLKDYWNAVSENIKEEDLDSAIEQLQKKFPTSGMFYSTFNLQELFWNFIEAASLREEVFEDENHGGIVGNEVNEIVYYNLGMFSQMINDYESIHFKDKPKQKLTGFLNFLYYSAQDYYPEGWLNNSYRTPNAVQIMTIFQSKGLEFPVVFVPRLNKNYLPIKRHGGKQIWHYIDRDWIKDQWRYETSEEDERRLMYVAITRSQKYLFLSRSIENRLYQKESIFAKEVSNSDYIITDKNFDYSDHPKLPPQGKSTTGAIQLNFSVLKAYFDCPYRFKLASLYGFVFPISEQMGYGNSVHNLLMELHRRYLDGEDVSKLDIDELADLHTHIPYGSPETVKGIQDKTSNVAKAYLDENLEDFENIEYAEKEIQIDLGDGIMVNGRMDLIKKKELGGKEVTTIVDFKSQKEAQRQDITMEQLAMYALGYKELTGNEADRLQIFNLDEENHTKQTQKLANNKTAEIKEKIVDSANNIRDNKLNKCTNVSACKDCWYKQLCSGIN